MDAPRPGEGAAPGGERSAPVRRRWLLRAVLGLLAACAAASLSWPYGWDQGIFAWVGDVIVRGGLPYRDAWDMKGPLVYYVFAFAEWAFGGATWGIRVVDVAFLAGACLALRSVTRHLTGRATAAWTATLFALWYATGTYWHTAQPDGWAAFLVLAAMTPLLLDGERLRPPHAALAGVCLGTTLLVKPFYGAFLVVPLLHLFLHLRGSRGRLAACAGAAAGGFAAPAAAMAAWLHAHGALDDYLEVAIRYPAQIYSGVTSPMLGVRVKGILDFALTGEVAVVALPAAAYGLVHLWRTARRTAIVLGAWVLVALVGVTLQARFFDYHWLPMHAPVAILAAVGLHEALGAAAGSEAVRGRGLALALFAAIVVHACVHPAFEVARWAAWVAGRTDTETYRDGFGSPGDDLRAAKFLAGRTSADDEIAMFGWNTAIVRMSGRRVATRFGFSMPLLMGGDTPVRRRYREEFLADVRAEPPLYVVVAPQSDELLGGRFGLADFPEFAEFVGSGYAEEARFGDLQVFRRRAAPDRR